MSKLGLEKEEELEIKLPRFTELWRKQANFRGNKQTNKQHIYLCFIDYTKAFDCVDHDKLWKAVGDMGIPDHLTCLLRNLYAGQEATDGTLDETTDWFKIEKGV